MLIIYVNSATSLSYIPFFIAIAFIVVETAFPCVPITEIQSIYFLVLPIGLPFSNIGIVPSVV